jgi:NADH:ubiquinone oxidoreductase subunit 6 (subunit J)
MYLTLFIIFGVLCVGGALNLLLQRHPINAALSLVVVMVSLAVLYLLLGAEFLAAAQVIVYSGAVMVLFTFVIMLLNAGKEVHTQRGGAAYAVGVRPANRSLSLRKRPPRTRLHGTLHRLDARPQPRPLSRPAAAL